MKTTDKNASSGKSGKDSPKKKGTFPEQDQSAKKSGDMAKDNRKDKK